MRASVLDVNNTSLDLTNDIQLIQEQLDLAQAAVVKLRRKGDTMSPKLQSVLQKLEEVSSTLNDLADEHEEAQRRVTRSQRKKEERLPPTSPSPISLPSPRPTRAKVQLGQTVVAIVPQTKKPEKKKKRETRETGIEEESLDEPENVAGQGQQKRVALDAPLDAAGQVQAVVVPQGPHAVATPKKAKQIGDGMPGRLNGTLIYFSLLAEKEGGFWVCPSRTIDDGEQQFDGDQQQFGAQTVKVRRNLVHPLAFTDLVVEEERRWYLEQLLQDILARFDINFPVLFANRGCELLDVKFALLKENPDTDALIDRLAKSVDAFKAASKVSPALSVTNNAGLMVAYTTHKRLKDTNIQGWYGDWKQQMGDMCRRCDLTFSTLERYLEVGHLMLCSNIIACLLPSFVSTHEAEVKALLADSESVSRLETAFRARNGSGALSAGGGGYFDDVKALALDGDNDCSKTPILGFGSGFNSLDGLFGQQGFALDYVPEKGKEEHDFDDEQLEAMSSMDERSTSEKGSTSSAVATANELVPQKCEKCNNMVVMFLCDGTDDGSGDGDGHDDSHEFCWKCSGYDTAPADELLYPGSHNVPIRSYVFCAEHITNIESCNRVYGDYLKTITPEGSGMVPLNLPSYVSFVQAEEARHIVRIFSNGGCKFNVIPIEPNGWCLFSCIARAMQQSLSDLISALKLFVGPFLTKKKKGFVENTTQFRKLWRELDVEDNLTVQELWSCDDGDLLLPMISECLNRDAVHHGRRVQLCVWNINGGALVKQALSYPAGGGGGEEDPFDISIHLLQTNVIVLHYDLLELRRMI